MRKKTGIRIGNQTSFSAPQFDTPFNFAVSGGFSAFEFFPDKKEYGEGWSAADISKKQCREIKKKASDSDISLSLHLPWQANPLKNDFNSIVTENMGFAADIGAKLVVIHLYAEHGVSEYVKEILPVISETGKRGVRLAIENTPLTSPEEFNLLFEILRERGDKYCGHVGMCLDIGHANLHESTRNDYLAYMDSLCAHVPIIHGHMHENYGESDSHLTLFTGPSRSNHGGISGVVKRLIEREFDGALIFEQWPDLSSLLVDAKSELEKIILSELPEKVISSEAVINSLDDNDLVAELLAADKKRRNWKEKLNGVLEILSREDLQDEHISLIAIYLSFVGRGAVNLTEDGGHYRPSHHARTARAVEKRLSEILSSDNYFILKKIYPWLPSHDKRFTSAEPLTRIRDIAHRNDIPRELKDEIKHSLQNKLHRCAGPEDLVTSERILKRITADGAAYSHPFVEEFITFHKELKEFFNAGSLTELLEKIIADGCIQEVETVRSFSCFIRTMDDKSGTPEKLTALLVKLTKLRKLFFPFHWKKYDERAQKLRLADIALDSLSFVTASRLNNALSKEQEKDFKIPLQGLLLILENIELNQIYPEESGAVRSELASLKKVFSAGRRDDLLRLRASLERVIRIADSHAERVLGLFQKQAVKLGEGLKVEKSAVRFFSEGSIRADLIFQLAKLACSMMKTVKTLLKIPEWETLFSGEAAGRLIDSGKNGFEAEYDEPVIVIVPDVSGEEEIPPGVTGIILKKSIPLLSHLGIRAREQGVIFVICEDEEIEKRCLPYKGEVVKLIADTKRFEIKPFFGILPKDGLKGETSVKFEEPNLTDEIAIIRLEKVTLSNAGGKALGLKRLTELSAAEGGIFHVPEALVLPFGTFEVSLKNDRGLFKEFSSKTEELYKNGINEESLRSIRELIGRMKIGVTDEAVKIFGKERSLIVRSSSNSEDLENFAGAGLYESVLNVKADNLERAIRRVYASLWSGRAVRARLREGLSYERIEMAVIIQEMLWPDLSFVIHSVNPVTGDEGEIYIEIAPGHGDILTSLSERGHPWQAAVSKRSGKIRLDSFSSFSKADLPGGKGRFTRRCVDYSKIPFHTDAGFRNETITRIAAAGKLLEEFFGVPQDIEGFVKGRDLYIVQSRNQVCDTT